MKQKVETSVAILSKKECHCHIENLKMTLTYGPSWEEHIAGDAEFKKLFQEKQDQLDRSSKGDGKGKNKNQGTTKGNGPKDKEETPETQQM